MSTTRYTDDHEWLRREDDGTVVLGITDYAQEQLGDIVYVELPAPQTAVAAGTQLAVVESVKAVGEINMPLAGTVTAVNERLAEEPELVNGDPEGEGWLVRFAPDGDGALDAYLDEAAYRALLDSL